MHKTPTRNATELKENATTATMKANELKEKQPQQHRQT